MNAFQLFGEELKKHRQAKQISLMQVSAATRINIKFLEAIEEGRFSVLPEPYVRAFLREYAQAIELSPADVRRQYDDAVNQTRPVPPPPADEQQQPSIVLKHHQKKVELLQLAQRNMLPLVGAVLLVVVVLLLSAGSSDTASNAPEEVSFDRAVKESEAAAVRSQPVRQSATPLAVARPDSLRLEMTTIDSLWMTVVIDGKQTAEYLFPPNYHRAWIAREQFAITLGNAGGATFRLNGKEVGVLGKRGAVVRNAIIDAETAMKL